MFKCRFARGAAALCCFSFLLIACSLDAVATATDVPRQRPVTVRDAIEMTKVGDHGYYVGGSLQEGVAAFSPDRSKFIVVLRRGDIESNTNVYSMLLWNSAEVATPTVRPRLLLEMRGKSNQPAISAVEWAADGQTVYFIGSESKIERRQVFALAVVSLEMRQITQSDRSVLAFSRDYAGARLAYVAERAQERIWNDSTSKSGIVVRDQFVPDLIAGIKNSRFRGPNYVDLFIQNASGVRRVNLDRELSRARNLVSLSPNGEYVITATQMSAQEVPLGWWQYEDFSVQRIRSFDKPKGRGALTESPIQRYELVHVPTGRSQVLLNAPVVLPTSPVWAPDSGSVILSQALLPLDQVDASEYRQRVARTFTVEIGVRTGRIAKIGDECDQAVSWERTTGMVTCTKKAIDDAAKLIRYRKSGASWHEADADRVHGGDLEVFLREDMNNPPKIYARVPGQSEASLVWDLNPQFKTLAIGRVEEITWKLANGESASGGLYYPINYEPGRRYPLVIQTHAWNPRRFWIDGPWTTAYAAQPLASRGMFVLQLLDQFVPDQYGTSGQFDEAEKALDIYRSAVDNLVRRRLIDAQRVGLIGFSHTCFYAKYALVHAPSLFAAVSVTEGEDGGYLQYITRSNSYVDADSIYGGPPFGHHLREWLKRSPGFNLDRVRAPLRITTLNPRFVLLDWEWFEGLSLLRLPVEMVLLEDGSHVLQKPAERVISQGGNVDWFDFWLNDHEDSDPSNADQFARWHSLREQRDLNLLRLGRSAKLSSSE